MSNDNELLRQYVEDRSENAFSELVREHLNLVYSAAWRETDGDAALAEDISQEVFTELARKARSLLRHPSVAGWLYMTVRHRAANLRRSNDRRRQREEACMDQNPCCEENTPEAAWQQIRPVLDEAMHELGDADRAAIVLRYLEDRSLRDVGAALGLQENAARMRVNRALDKLRGLLAQRGVSSSAAGITAALAFGAIMPAPSAFAASVAGTALAGSAVAASTSLTLMKIMTLSKVQISLIGAVLVAGFAVPMWQQSRLKAVRSELARVQTPALELATLRNEVSRLRQLETDFNELAELREWKSNTQPELLRLRGMAGVARRANAEVAELRAQLQRQGSNVTSGFSVPMGDLMRAAAEQEVTNRLGRLTGSLRLTQEQVQAARDILHRHAQVSAAGVQQAISGKIDKAELTKLAKGAGNEEEQIKALLTPEQLASYEGYKSDEASHNARVGANTELLMMQSLNLSPEQQDQVFSALYDVTLTQMTGATPPPAFANSTEQIEWVCQQKAKALEPVLNSTQMASYRQQQELQIKFAKQVLSNMEGGAAGVGR